MDTPQGREAWDAAAAAVLRKSGRLRSDDPDEAAWQRLARTTVDGVQVPPLGTPAEVVGMPANGLPGQTPFVRGASAAAGTGWDVRAPIFDPDPQRAAASAHSDLETGATSLWVAVEPGGTAVHDLGRVLDGVFTDIAPVVLSASDPAAWTAFTGLIAEKPAAGTSLGADPLGRALRARVPAEEVTSRLERAAGLARAAGIGAVVVDATAAHEAGAGEIGELAWSLAAGVHYLRVLTGLGLDVDTACGLIGFRYAATVSQFPTIAKLRAARRLWHRVTELSGASEPARAQYQHAVTSRPMTTRYDPWVNMLRGTVAAFAAGVGGAAAITVWPFDAALGIPDEFGRRIARNVSALLLEESHVGVVADPAGGAYAVEKLTHDMALAGWKAFGELEAAGGAETVLADGSVLAEFERVAELRYHRIATRRWPITGVSEFPIAGEQLLDRRPWTGDAGWAELLWAAPFERLRDRPTARPVVVLPLGSVAAHGPRLTFMTNLLTAGGIGVDVLDPLPAGIDVGADIDGSVVLIAGSDDDYRSAGAALVGALRAAGASAVLLAGRPPAELREVVDDMVAVGDDMLAFLDRVRGRLTITVGVA